MIRDASIECRDTYGVVCVFFYLSPLFEYTHLFISFIHIIFHMFTPAEKEKKGKIDGGKEIEREIVCVCIWKVLLSFLC